MPFPFTEEEANTRRLLFAPLKTIEDFQAWVHLFLNIELPGECVDPDSDSSPLKQAWFPYDHLVNGGPEDVSRVLFYAARTSGKTLSFSISEVLVLMHARTNIVHLAAILDQSKNCQKYLKHHFSAKYLRNFLEGDSQRTTEVAFCIPANDGLILTKQEWSTLSPVEQDDYTLSTASVEVIVATLQSCNGKHAGLVMIDELDVIQNPRILKEAVNIPTPFIKPDGNRALPLTVLTSSRKTASGPVQDEINNSVVSGLVVKHFNILDVTEGCPKSRHRPDLPKLTVYRSDSLLSAIPEEKWLMLSPKDKDQYEKDTCYNGCLNNCSLYGACRGHLANRQSSTSKFLKPISYVIQQFRNNDLDTAQSQLLSRKPMSEGLVYPRLSKETHILTPAQAYFKITGKACHEGLSKAKLMELIAGIGEVYGGMDHGFTHYWSYVQGVSINNVGYITHAVAAPELEPSQQLDTMEAFRKWDPIIFADTEDPAANKMFKKAGFRLKDWNKAKLGVVGGINIMRRKMTPTLGKPTEFYIIRDIGEDPIIDLLFRHLSEHAWKLDAAGKPMDKVSDNKKDLPDACRYLIQNAFSGGGSVVVTEDASSPKMTPVNADGERSYDVNNWMTQKINELTGDYDRIPVRSRPPMKVENISSNSNYYADQNEVNKDSKGAKRGILWDLG